MAGVDAFGVQLLRSDMEISPNYTAVANVLTISGPTRTRDTYDTTDHDSEDGFREFIGGLRDAGELTFSIHYDPNKASHELLDNDFLDVDPRDYRLITPPAVDQWQWDFSGIVTNLGDEFPYDGKMQRSVTIKITGKPVLTAADS